MLENSYAEHRRDAALRQVSAPQDNPGFGSPKAPGWLSRGEGGGPVAEKQGAARPSMGLAGPGGPTGRGSGVGGGRLEVVKDSLTCE